MRKCCDLRKMPLLLLIFLIFFQTRHIFKYKHEINLSYSQKQGNLSKICRLYDPDKLNYYKCFNLQGSNAWALKSATSQPPVLLPSTHLCCKPNWHQHHNTYGCCNCCFHHLGPPPWATTLLTPPLTNSGSISVTIGNVTRTSTTLFGVHSINWCIPNLFICFYLTWKTRFLYLHITSFSIT